MNETRADFKPTLWKTRDGSAEQVLSQVWFAGDHSDIGGGHHAFESDLSDVALGWMIVSFDHCTVIKINC